MHLRSGATSSSPTNRDQGWGLLHAAGAPTADLIAAQFAKLDEGLAQLNPLLEPGSYAFGGRLTTADLWLTPVCFCLEGLMAFARQPDLVARHEAIAGYGKLAQADPVLGRVWREMTDGLVDFMKARGEAANG